MSWAERFLRQAVQAAMIISLYAVTAASAIAMGAGVPAGTVVATVLVAFAYPLLAKGSAALTWRILFGRRPSPQQTLRTLIAHALGPGTAAEALQHIRQTIQTATGAREVIITDERITLTGASPTPAWSGLLRPLTPGVLVIARNAQLETQIRDRLAANAEQARAITAARLRLDAAEQLERGRMESHIRSAVMPSLTSLADALAAGDTASAQDLAAKALGQIRATGRGLHPPVLRDLGLIAALRSIAPLKVDPAADARFASEIETAVFLWCAAALRSFPSAEFSLAADDLHLVVTAYADGMAVQEWEADRVTALGGSQHIDAASAELRIPR